MEAKLIGDLPSFECKGRYGSSKIVQVKLRLVKDQVMATCPYIGRKDGNGFRCANYRTDAGSGLSVTMYQTRLCTEIKR